MYIAEPAFNQQLNDMSFWFPIIDRLGRFSKMPDMKITHTESGGFESIETPKDFILHIPETKIFYAPNEIGYIVDGVKTPEFDRLVKDVTEAHEQFGEESFLRTGQTSNKHEWVNTCHLTKDSNISDHIARLIEFSMMVDLPFTTFVVRKMIPTNSITVAFEDMPIAREIRMFVQKGEVICAHPYWPEEAFRTGVYTDDKVTDEQISKLQEMPDMVELNKLGEYISKSFAFAWSVDFLQDISGNWWLTDMALGNSSYHFPRCEYGGKHD